MHNYPLLASKQTSARIDFLRQGGRLVNKKGTHNVKIRTENKTKQIKPCARAKGNGDGMLVSLQPPAQAVAGHAAHSQRRQHHANAEEIGLWQMGFSLYRAHQMVSPMPPFWGVTTFCDGQTGQKFQIFRIFVRYFAHEWDVYLGFTAQRQSTPRNLYENDSRTYLLLENCC